MIINKINHNSNAYCKNYRKYHNVNCIRTALFLWSFSTGFVSSIFSVHSSTIGSINFFLYLHFEWSKYSPISQDLSHSHSQTLGLKKYPLSHTPLSINFLHPHLHLSLFQRCFLLQIIGFNLHMHLQDSCHFMCH